MNATEARTFPQMSAANAAIVASHFACGCEPYDRVFTYKRWIAQGMQVQKGEKGLHLATLIPKFNDENEFTHCIPRTTIVFCRHQVAPKGENGNKPAQESEPEITDHADKLDVPSKLSAMLPKVSKPETPSKRSARLSKPQPKPKAKKKSANGKVKRWIQTKPDVWLRKARSRDSSREILTHVFTAQNRSVSSDGFRIHLIPNFKYGEYGDGKYPDITPFLENEGNSVIVSSRHLRKAAEHCKAMSKVSVKLDFSKEKLVFSAKDAEVGNNSVTIEDGEGWNGSGPAVYLSEHVEPVSLAVNPKYFLEAIMGMKDCVTLSFESATRPLHITDGDRVAVIMPMHLGR